MAYILSLCRLQLHKADGHSAISACTLFAPILYMLDICHGTCTGIMLSVSTTFGKMGL
jgi:hypothetical protein